MRKEFMVMAGVAAVALVGYLSWQGAQESPVQQTSAPAPATPQATAPQNAPAPAEQPAPAQPAPSAQPAQQ